MDYGTIVNTDKYGNIYVTGVMERVFTGSPNDYSYATFWKFDKNGHMLWQDTISGAIDAKTDDEGNTYMVAGKNLLKYNSNGTVLWNITCDMQVLMTLTLHSEGGVVVSGSIADRGRIARYDVNGNKLWQIGGDNWYGSGKSGRSLVCNKNGDIFYAEGYDYNAKIFYVLKHDKNGNLLSKFRMPHLPLNITLDSQDNFYIYYFGPQYLTKFSSQGDSLWTKVYHGGRWPGLTGLAVDANNNLLVSGWYNIDLMINHVMIVNTGQQESFVMKYSKDGDIIWLAHSLMDTVRKADMYLSSMNLRGNEIVCTGQINGGESFGSYTLSTPVSQYVDLLLVKLVDEPAVGIRESSRTNPHFQVFPNPSTGQFTISLLHYPTNNSSLKIYSSAGTKVFEHIINDNSNPRILDLSHLKKGSYFIQLTFQDGTETRKVIIE
jgi:hypothetical protein